MLFTCLLYHQDFLQLAKRSQRSMVSKCMKRMNQFMEKSCFSWAKQLPRSCTAKCKHSAWSIVTAGKLCDLFHTWYNLWFPQTWQRGTNVTGNRWVNWYLREGLWQIFKNMNNSEYKPASCFACLHYLRMYHEFQSIIVIIKHCLCTVKNDTQKYFSSFFAYFNHVTLLMQEENKFQKPKSCFVVY